MITSAAVKELREMTGCGMMDCKKALTEANGDMDKAIEWLRERPCSGSEKGGQNRGGRTCICRHQCRQHSWRCS